jgi:hypothetical protein
MASANALLTNGPFTPEAEVISIANAASRK